MVGTEPRTWVSELARCSVVSYYGEVLFSKYVRTEMPIMDYCSLWSAITGQHMCKAISFQVAQKEILELLKGKALGGTCCTMTSRSFLKYVYPRGQTPDTTYVSNLLS